MPERPKNRKARVLTAAGITTAVFVAAGGAVSYATSQGTSPAYVTATVGSYPVVQTLQATGTTEPSSAATVSFAVSGTVASVPVAMGDTVRAGQVLATLDTTSLKYALAAAEGQVANANLTLTQAESGQVSAASGTGGSAGTGGPKAGTGAASVTGTSGTGTSAGGNAGAGGSSGAGGSTGNGGANGTSGSRSGVASGTGGASGASKSGTGGTGGGTNSSSAGVGTSKSGSALGTGKSSAPSPSGSGSIARITVAQKLLLSTVRRADSLLAKTRTDLAAATTVCSSQGSAASTPTPAPIPTPTPMPTPTPTPKPTPTPSSTLSQAHPQTQPPAQTPMPTAPSIPKPAPGGRTPSRNPAPSSSPNASPAVSWTTAPAGPSTCIPAQQLVLGDESQLLLLQQGLSGQETSLDSLLMTLAASARASSATVAPTAGSSTRPAAGATSASTSGTAKAASSGAAPTGSGSNGSASAGKSSSTSTTAATSAAKAGGSASATGSASVVVSAAQLAADQAAVDAANASVAVAQQQLSEATIVSPLTGTVSSVGLTVGQQVTPGSTSTAVDVIDPTGHGVSLSVDVSKIPLVKLGDRATVVPDGSAAPLAATVSYIAAAPTTAGSSAYNVQLAFTANPTTLRDGIQAAVTITTAQAVGALAVPTSAVNHRGALDYVLVLNGGTTTTQIITVGAVGATYTQVTQGLTAGQRVVLANPNQAIPSNTITGRIARITGGVTGTTGVLGGSTGGVGGGFGGGFGGGTAGAPGTRPGG